MPAPRPAEPVVAPPPAVSTDEPPDDVLFAAADAAPGVDLDDDYETARPAGTGVAVTSSAGNQNADTRRPPPPVAEAAARVPAATRSLLTELFKAEITAVKRLPRDQLR